MKLYWFTSTNPQKIRLALEELGLDYERVPVNLYNREHQSGPHASLLPRKKVPALEVDGQIIHESGAILLYLAQNHGLWPEDQLERFDATSLLFMESSAFQDLAGVFFFNRVVLPANGVKPDEDRIAKAKKKIRPLLNLLEARLEDREWLCGDFSVIDCAYAPWLTVIDLDEHPRLSDYVSRIRQRPAWVRSEFEY